MEGRSVPGGLLLAAVPGLPGLLVFFSTFFPTFFPTFLPAFLPAYFPLPFLKSLHNYFCQHESNSPGQVDQLFRKVDHAVGYGQPAQGDDRQSV